MNERRFYPGHFLHGLLRDRILVLDGAMGTMIQGYGLAEADYRGGRFASHEKDLKGNNDLLCLTRPEIIEEIHRSYLEAGADIIETNTFNANGVSMTDYRMENLAYEINVAAARIARKAADAFRTPERPRLVAGAVGPTNRTASLSPKVEDPSFRNVDFDRLRTVYAEQIRGLLDGGVDLVLVETVFDTLNAKAALCAAEDCFEARGERTPLMLSVTITDRSGRTLSGQTLEAFWVSVGHSDLLSVGLNCALGPSQMRPYLEELSRLAPVYVSVYPNAGIPDEFGRYRESPEDVARVIREFADAGFVNIVGGCCGTNPKHIAAIAESCRGSRPRSLPKIQALPCFSGLEPLVVRPESNFLNVGERCNVAGSKRFLRLITEGNYDSALEIAREQVESGAQILDVNMDEALLESKEAMGRFLRLIASDPDVSKVPLMIDSSKWSVIEEGLKNAQGRCIVNSISLKEGEVPFREQASKVLRYGAAVIVMAFDEQGQAESAERKFEICARAYRILVGMGFRPQDIVFDPNVFAVGTGIEAHANYALDYMEAVRRIKASLPGCLVSGGVSNVSFAFRGNDAVREAMHSAFLYHAIRAGMDMGIVHAGQIGVYEDIPAELKVCVEDVILNRRPDATERLVEFAQSVKQKGKEKTQELAWREQDVDERLAYSLVHGDVRYIEEDVAESLKKHGAALRVIEEPLMRGMNIVGDLFGSGKMFLPQVVKSARVMKKAVACLLPYLQSDGGLAASKAGKILLATVKGDVHDIGKNIVGVVLGCNNYEIIDLGVMTPTEKILQTAIEQKVDIIGLSGLITPSLEEMAHVAGEMERQGFRIPLLIGGATTSRVHTAVKIAPRYSGPAVHVADASRCVGVVGSLLSAERKAEYVSRIRAEYEQLRIERSQMSGPRMVSLTEARSRRLAVDWAAFTPAPPSFFGIKGFDDFDLSRVRPKIDWTPFFLVWQLKGRYPKILDDPKMGEEARKLLADAHAMLDEIIEKKWLRARGVIGLFPANAIGDDIEVYADERRDRTIAIFHTLRQQAERDAGRPYLAMADFVAPRESGKPDYIGAFAVTAGIGAENAVGDLHDDYREILLKALSDRLAEAFAETLHEDVRKAHWGYAVTENWTNEELIAEAYQGIRPAPGYPACPDHTEKATLFELLRATENTSIRLTESFAMHPASSICGLYFSHPESRYFPVGKIGRDQVVEYARRKGASVPAIEKWLAPYLAYEV